MSTDEIWAEATEEIKASDHALSPERFGQYIARAERAAEAKGRREAVQRIRLLALSGDWCIADHNRLLAILDGMAAL
jgi:hypothetical protein